MSEALDRIHEAVQAFTNSIADDDHPAGVVTQCIVVYEVSSLSDDGTDSYQISYTVPLPGMSVSATLGLAEAGLYFIRRDVLGDRDDDA